INFKYLLLDLNRTDDEAILPVVKLLDAVFSLAKMRFEKRLSPKEINVWWAGQTSQLSNDDKSELVDWMTLAFKAPLNIKNTLKTSLEKGDFTAMKTGFELWADEYRGACVLEGRREGRREAALKTARKLKDKGMSINDIAEATELSVDEILQL
ncbi:MAG: hypothetical protein LBB74_00170, partial [Chitinispirillales bacterium]|nr:hypothetical protein [Chitinispirillales bacterium]